MHETFYFLTSVISSIGALTLALVLAGLKIHNLEGFEKYNKARWLLAGAFAASGLLGAAEFLLGDARATAIMLEWPMEFKRKTESHSINLWCYNPSETPTACTVSITLYEGTTAKKSFSKDNVIF